MKSIKELWNWILEKLGIVDKRLTDLEEWQKNHEDTDTNPDIDTKPDTPDTNPDVPTEPDKPDLPNDPQLPDPNRVRQNLLVNAITNRLPGNMRQQAITGGIQFVEFLGKKAIKFTLPDNKNDNVRSEILLDPLPKAFRFGGYYYFPSASWKGGVKDSIFFQVHNHNDTKIGEPALVPNIALFADGDQLKVMINWDKDRKTTDTTTDGRQNYELGPVILDRWVKITGFIRQNYQATADENERGVVIIAFDDVQKVKHYGPNCYNDEEAYGYLKTGIYDRNVNKKRELYIAEFRIGNDKSTNLDIAP